MNDVNAERPYCTELYSINIRGFYNIKVQFVFGGCNSWSYFETFLLPTDAHNVKKHRVIKTF